MKRATVTIYQKLLAGYLILLATLLLPCLFSIYSIYKLEQTISRFQSETLEISKAIESARSQIPTLQAEARRLTVLHKQDSVELIIPLLTELETELDPDVIKGPPELKETFLEFQRTLSRFRELVQDVAISLGTLDPSLPSLADELREQEIKQLSTHLLSLLSKAELIKKKELQRRSKYLQSLIRHIEEVTIILLAVAFLIALIAPWLLARTIKRPIEKLQQGTKAIGQGNFDHTIPITSQDEFGRLADSFNEMARRLKELDRLKSDFIAVASHELKTPLAAMMEASKLLSEPAIGPLNPKQEKLVGVLNKSMRRFKSLIEELLDLSKLQAGLIQVEKERHLIGNIIQEAVDTVRPGAEAKSMQISVQFQNPGTEEDKIVVDRKRFLRVLINLLDNAVKFSEPGGSVVLSIQKREEKARKRRSRSNKTLLQLTVVDQGPGIPSNEQEQVFEKFYQVHDMQKQSGSGLGLAIAREIITAHGGKIWIESPPPDKIAITKGKGTAIFIELPWS